MRTGIAITATLLAAGLLLESMAEAQDQEEGPVELAPTSDATVSARAQVDTNASAASQASTPSYAGATPTEPAGALRVYGGFRLAVAGGFKPTDPSEDVMAIAVATPGLSLGADYVVMDYFAIGGETRFSWARPKLDDQRVMLWDLVVKPRARMVMSGESLELYTALPFGLSISNHDNDLEAERTGKASATLGLSAGAYYFFTQNLGINAELGWQWNWIRYEDEAIGDVAMRLGQLSLLNVNFVYAF